MGTCSKGEEKCEICKGDSNLSCWGAGVLAHYDVNGSVRFDDYGGRDSALNFRDIFLKIFGRKDALR